MELAYTFEQGGLHYVWLYDTDEKFGAYRTKAEAEAQVEAINRALVLPKKKVDM